MCDLVKNQTNTIHQRSTASGFILNKIRNNNEIDENKKTRRKINL